MVLLKAISDPCQKILAPAFNVTFDNILQVMYNKYSAFFIVAMAPKNVAIAPI